MSKKKILFIHHSGLLGGAGVSLYNMWKTLEQDFDVVTYIPEEPKDLYNFFIGKSMDVNTFDYRIGKITYYSGGNNIGHPKFWFHAIRIIFHRNKWRKIINVEKPDIVIINSKVISWFGQLLKEMKIKSICIVRETIIGKPSNIINSFINKMLENFSIVTFLSKYDSDQTNLKKTKSIISPDYLKITEYSNKTTKEQACDLLSITAHSFNVLFVGGINELKGIDLAIEALIKLSHLDIKLVVAGYDAGKIKIEKPFDLIKLLKKRKAISISKKIRKTILNNSLDSKVNFIGVQTDITTAYTASDLLIFPMKKAHQARPAFEIGAQKKTLIIPDFKNIREFFINNYNCITCEPNNSDSLSHAIEMLYSNKSLLNFLGENNFRTTLKYHSEDVAMKFLKKEINKLLK